MPAFKPKPQHLTDIPCAIIGLGRIGSSLEQDPYREKPCSHAGVVTAHPRTYLLAGVDKNPNKRQDFESNWGVSTYPNLDALLLKKKPAIVHIATYPETHLLYLEGCLKHRIPVIICEKPLAYDLISTKKIIKKIALSSSIVIVNHERRFALDYKHVKQIITTKQYGSLLSLQARLYLGRQRKLKDMLWEDGTHLIDAMHFLTDTTLTVNTVFREKDSIGSNLWVHGKLGKTDVVLECGSGRDHLVFELDLSFETGRIRIGNGLYQEFTSDISPYYQSMRSLRRVSHVRFPKTRYFYGMMEHAVEAHDYPDVKHESSATDAFKVMEVLDTILSIQTKKK